MNTFSRFLIWGALASAMLGPAACGDKNSDPQAPAPTATLSGQVSPAGAVTLVTATDASGKATTATLSSTGAYSFPAMLLGACTLTFSPAAGYTTPAPVSVTLAAAGTTVAPVTATLAKASASYRIEGQLITAAYIFSLVNAGDRYLRFSAQPGGAPGPTINLDMRGSVPVVGTYQLNSSAYNASYLSPDYFTYYSDQFGSGQPDRGTLTITAVNATLRRFAGTFQFVGRDVSSSSPSGYIPPGTPLTRAITNGVFENIPY